MSNHEKSLEENFKNENVILWFRSFLQLPMRNKLFTLFSTEETKLNLVEELRKMMKV